MQFLRKLAAAALFAAACGAAAGASMTAAGHIVQHLRWIPGVCRG